MKRVQKDMEGASRKKVQGAAAAKIYETEILTEVATKPVVEEKASTKLQTTKMITATGGKEGIGRH